MDNKLQKFSLHYKPKRYRGIGGPFKRLLQGWNRFFCLICEAQKMKREICYSICQRSVTVCGCGDIILTDLTTLIVTSGCFPKVINQKCRA
jgi:hypothetical protein